MFPANLALIYKFFCMVLMAEHRPNVSPSVKTSMAKSCFVLTEDYGVNAESHFASASWQPAEAQHSDEAHVSTPPESHPCGGSGELPGSRTPPRGAVHGRLDKGSGPEASPEAEKEPASGDDPLQELPPGNSEQREPKGAGPGLDLQSNLRSGPDGITGMGSHAQAGLEASGGPASSHGGAGGGGGTHSGEASLSGVPEPPGADTKETNGGLGGVRRGSGGRASADGGFVSELDTGSFPPSGEMGRAQAAVGDIVAQITESDPSPVFVLPGADMMPPAMQPGIAGGTPAASEPGPSSGGLREAVVAGVAHPEERPGVGPGGVTPYEDSCPDPLNLGVRR